MTVEFLAENGETTSNVVGKAGEDGTNQRFSATVSIPLTDDITLSALLVLPDGTRQTQPLDTYGGLYSGSLPDVVNIADTDLENRAQIENGTISFSDAMEFAVTFTTKPDNILIPRAEAVSTRLGLFKNQRLVAWAEPISADEQTCFQGFDGASYFRLEPLSFSFAAGDILEAAVVLTDEYGRETICPGNFPLTLDSDGQSLTFPGSDGSNTAAAYALDTDITHWRFD